MDATEVTVQMPREEAEFLETYAKEHATSVAEIFTRYARRLQSTARRAPHPENVKFSGAVRRMWMPSRITGSTLLTNIDENHDNLTRNASRLRQPMFS